MALEFLELFTRTSAASKAFTVSTILIFKSSTVAEQDKIWGFFGDWKLEF